MPGNVFQKFEQDVKRAHYLQVKMYNSKRNKRTRKNLFLEN